MPMDIGRDKPSAVNADNCCGEKFFEVGMIKKATGCKLRAMRQSIKF
jgi:hypothetical protein